MIYKCPNGQIILGLTEEELNYYKDKFLIIYSNDTKFEYSSQTQKPNNSLNSYKTKRPNNNLLAFYYLSE